MATKSGGGTTTHISRKAAENVFHALRYAEQQGRALNLHVTINLHRLGFTDDEADVILRTVKARLVRWWAYQRSRSPDLGPFDGVFARANPDGHTHAHWIVRVPPALRVAFEVTLRNRLSKVTGRSDLGKALQIDRANKPRSLAKYILEGVHPSLGPYFHMSTSDEGEVFGRRTGTTRGIGRAARRDAGWRRKGAG